jgi:hypothetical protein
VEPPPLPAAPGPEASEPATAEALPEPSARGVGLRNGAVYAAYSLVVLVVQAALFLVLNESTDLLAASPLCLVVLPAIAWGAGWLSIGALFEPPPDVRLDRSPRLGVAVCLIPNVLLCVAAGFLFVLDRMG